MANKATLNLMASFIANQPARDPRSGRRVIRPAHRR
jgi:hypothetical protein